MKSKKPDRCILFSLHIIHIDSCVGIRCDPDGNCFSLLLFGLVIDAS